MANEILPHRRSLATAANGEIALIAQTLRAHIDEHEPDMCGPISMLSRGMLARIEHLTETIDECLGNGDDWSDQELELRVLDPQRARTSHAEVSHG